MESEEQMFDLPYKWRDITDEFKLACGELDLGELVHDQNFSLFDAMSAIELMDPKMDAGLLQTSVQSYDQAVVAGLVKMDKFTSGELLDIVDAMIACYVTWLDGHSLAQTMFICLYLHEPYNLNDSVVKRFALAMLKLVGLCRDIVQKAGVWEEEDFQSHAYGFDLATKTTDHRVIGMLKEVEEEILSKIKVAAEQAALEDVPDFKKEYETLNALLLRAHFVRLYFVSLISFTAKDAKGILIPSGAAKAGHANQVEEAAKIVGHSQQLLAKLREEFTLDADSAEQEDVFDGLAEVPGFIPGVTRHMLPPTFPRQTQIYSRLKTYQMLERLLDRMQQISLMPLSSGSFDAILDFCRKFSSKETCVLSRSILMLVYFPSGDKSHFIENITESMTQFTQPPVLLPRSGIGNDPGGKVLLDEFFGSCGVIFLQILQVCGHNRARQREKIAMVLEEMPQLQEEADRTDGYFHQLISKLEPGRSHIAVMASYTLHHTLALMKQYLLIHFELELFSVYEYTYVYWYLYAIIFKWTVNILSRVDSFMHHQEGHLVRLEKSEKSSKGDKKKMKRKKPKFHREEIMGFHMFLRLCEAYYRTMLGLHMDGKLDLPRFANNDRLSSMRYEHRLVPFSHLTTPPFCNYVGFLDSTGFDDALNGSSASVVFAQAAEIFDEVKGMIGTYTMDPTEASNLIKICKNNSVLLRLLDKGHHKDSKKQPEMDFSLHPHFPLLKLAK